MSSLVRGTFSRMRRPGSLQHAVSSAATLTRLLCTRRTFSVSSLRHNDSDLFNYTSGRWLVNESRRLAERKRVFNVDGLRQLAAEAVDRSPNDVVDFRKLDERDFNRDFLITMDDGFKLVARIPYHCTEPKELAISSEVATMYLMRDHGIPVPQVFLYSPTPDNLAETEYIIMSYLPGTSLQKRWSDLNEEEIMIVCGQIAQLERKMMENSFPAGGSLYFTEDLKRAGEPGIRIAGPHAKPGSYSIGPDLQSHLWYGKRAEFPAYRGPYETVEKALVAEAELELGYLEQFGRPQMPFDRVMRFHNIQPPSLSEHIENLQRYLLIAPSLALQEPHLDNFHIRHPLTHPMDILVDSNLQITGLLDWHRTTIQPLFLLARIPPAFQNYGDPVTDACETPVFTTKNKDDWEWASRNLEGPKDLHRRRLVHFHYVKSTEEHNPIHYCVWAEDPHHGIRAHIYRFASSQWESDLSLKIALVEAAEIWEGLSGVEEPCPIVFEPADVNKTKELRKRLEAVGPPMTAELMNRCLWFSHDDYDVFLRMVEDLKEEALKGAASDPEAMERLDKYWPFDDFDEEEYYYE